jgi:hypothetical protein
LPRPTKCRDDRISQSKKLMKSPKRSGKTMKRA